MNNTIAYKLAQLPRNTLFVGLDPHKREHAMVVMNDKAQVLAKFKIANDRQGFDTLLERCEHLRQRHGAATYLFAIEPGGHYWRNVAYFLTEQGHTFRLINPFTLKRQRDGNDLMRRKNDYRDAQMAAQLLREGKYTWTALPQGTYAELRQAHNSYQQLVAEAAQVKLQLTTALDGLFPEFMTVFKHIDGKTALTILRTCPNPADIAALSEDEFVNYIRRDHDGRLMRRKVRRLHQLTSNSAGIRAGARAQSRTVQMLSERLTFVKSQRRRSEDYLIQVFWQLDESQYLISIHGLGMVNAAGLLAHIGDIRNYSHIKQLPKLAGIVPVENRSADHAARRTPMSKKGRPGLRMVLYRSVIALLRHNPAFKQYVQRLTQRVAKDHPLKKREAIGAAMNKLLRIVYALLTKRQLFDARIMLAA